MRRLQNIESITQPVGQEKGVTLFASKRPGEYVQYIFKNCLFSTIDKSEVDRCVRNKIILKCAKIVQSNESVLKMCAKQCGLLFWPTLYIVIMHFVSVHITMHCTAVY